MLIDGHHFECTECGDCCRWEGFVLLNEEDIYRLKGKEKLGLDKFMSDFTREVELDGDIVPILANKKGSKECIYLEGNKCSVYELRPKQCKEYPIKFDSKCEGFRKERKCMASKYEKVVKDMNKKLEGDSSDKTVLANLYESLNKGKSVSTVIAKAMESGIDFYLKDEKVKIASLADLYAFTRVSSNHLVHKATKDLWALEESVDGSIIINRLFDDSGNPIKS